MAELQGRRLPDGYHYGDSEPGDYWKQPRGSRGTDGERGRDWDWTTRDPSGHLGTLGSHTVEEHEDGTITVTPSILDPHTYTADEIRAMGIVSIIDGDQQGWHGWLERGVWRSA